MNKTKTKAVTPSNTCKCGCGEPVTRSFKQGHDARLKGRLLRQYRTGTAGEKRSALAQARKLGWPLAAKGAE
jgi:hypothetical protein